MTYKEKLFHLVDGLDEKDQKSAYEYLQSLASMNVQEFDHEDEIHILGNRFFVVPD
ncbi:MULTISPECIES: hypothetical protein [Paenibacillus]|uniref:hypothetical protein n=1 Tax=Paenibacillus TaxID=44249 RepID=UPI0022B860ED|nr:hypothetical protein [Paenibacillus caseinilyticus]MCZ8521920.1 hypothetical protein [Paenibacillus caseinilyticus]